MTRIKRPVPNAEWVHMYRHGIPAAKIAAGPVSRRSACESAWALLPVSSQDPGLRSAHQSAAPAVPRLTGAGWRNLADIMAFHRVEGRLPITGRSARESAPAGWRARRREQAAAGTVAPAFSAELGGIRGWGTTRGSGMPTRPGGNCGRATSQRTWRPDTVGPGTRRPKAGRSGPWVCGWLRLQEIDCRAGKPRAGLAPQ